MKRRKNEFGQALLELVVAAAVALALSVWAAGFWAQQVEQQAVAAMAQWLSQLHRATEQAFLSAESIPLPEPIDDGSNDVGHWIDWLKRAGHLPDAFRATPPLPYRVKLESVSLPATCQAHECAKAVLLVALPGDPKPGSKRESIALGLLAELPGRALAVTSLSPQWLQGATFRLPNPLQGRPAWPLGSVAVLAWRSDIEPPYVRLHERRPVNLHGAVTASQGVVIAAAAPLSADCHPEGRLMRANEGGLALCQGGRWQAVDQPPVRHFQACSGIDERGMLLGFLQKMGMFGGDTSVCTCRSGYLPRYVGPDLLEVAGVTVHQGYVCEKL